MTLYDALIISGQTLAVLSTLGYKPGDEGYLPMFHDYLEMTAPGNKKTYVVAVLADKYHISERTVYNVIRRFTAHCNGGAAG